MTACDRPGCSGTIEDGFCDECGRAPLGGSGSGTAATGGTASTTASTTAGSTAAGGTTGTATGTGAGAGTAARGTGTATSTGAAGTGIPERPSLPDGSPCPRAGCSGTMQDGFCDECGLAAPAAGTGPSSGAGGTTGTGTGSGDGTLGSGSGRLSSRTGSGRTVSGRSGGSVSVITRTGTVSKQRGRLGAGLVTVPSVPRVDPMSVVLSDPEVPERKRFCSNHECGRPVGRSRDGQSGRSEGYCTNCGTRYSFSPKLHPGDMVRDQYEVRGCLAHGGMGWIYLAWDHKLETFVVLKGLLNNGDEDAMRAARLERQYLVSASHPNIVEVFNFVEHPDPITGLLDGYIVMSYVGGRSVRQIAEEHRRQHGAGAPLPVEQVIAYALESLSALGYLHSQGLIYCDLKPDNIIQSEDTLKLIDLGAVWKVGPEGEGTDVFGTPGYQAPELEEGHEPSVASDLYTVARMMAVLSCRFPGFARERRHVLPSPEEAEVFARYESFHRLLLRATDPDPRRRFASAEEMADQLTGVLREIRALQTGEPRPALSTLFGHERTVADTELVEPRPVLDGGDAPPAGATAVRRLDPRATALALPLPRVDAGDPAAAFLASLMAPDAGETLKRLEAAPVESVEVRLRRLHALLELGEYAGAGAELDQLAALGRDSAEDWRVVWFRGVLQLASGNPEPAAESFDALYDAFPGEAAPKLALAACSELLGEYDNAAQYYRLVWTTDRSWVSAGFGLARVLLASGDRAGAVEALEQVPATSNSYVPARVAAIRARLHGRTAEESLRSDLLASAQELVGLGDRTLDDTRRHQLRLEVLHSALDWVTATGRANGAPAAGTAGAVEDILGYECTDHGIRLGLERSLREMARRTEDRRLRIALVDQANRVRPRTWT
ncbi:serine/threonine-protein kinase [Allostreptomyces psammosilenae]|uniref:non-specific serine/threonine protein kinase n=1 Tax=Allostreptomyces psammosilenae TaxID=1892865 RepID=A0A853AD46_9ACTN|nr:serine/threonine-protein kinase [Allostreptomyces psammosilenae]NYI08368.1 serine/threonine-protein kinase PknG [Allostreptomyces psammosilenae]